MYRLKSTGSSRSTVRRKKPGCQQYFTEKAKEIALDHAGKSYRCDFVKAKSDYEDGRAVFEIEFVVSSGNTIKEYDYEIAASDGSIISYDYGIEGDSTPTAIQAGSSQNTSEISLEAKEIALSHAVASANAFEMEENWIGMMACLFMRLNLKLEAMSTAMKLMQPQDRLSNSIRSGMIK